MMPTYRCRACGRTQQGQSADGICPAASCAASRVHFELEDVKAKLAQAEAEVDRLEAKVCACVHDHNDVQSACMMHERWLAAKLAAPQGRASLDERTAIVAWLRRTQAHDSYVAESIAEALERGDDHKDIAS